MVHVHNRLPVYVCCADHAAALPHRATASDLPELTHGASAASAEAAPHPSQHAASSLAQSLQQHTLQQTGSRLQHTSVPGDDFRLQQPTTRMANGSANNPQQHSSTADGRLHRSSIDVSDLSWQLQAPSLKQCVPLGDACRADTALKLGKPLHESALSHDIMTGRSQSSPALVGASPPNSRKVTIYDITSQSARREQTYQD